MHTSENEDGTTWPQWILRCDVKTRCLIHACCEYDDKTFWMSTTGRDLPVPFGQVMNMLIGILCEAFPDSVPNMSTAVDSHGSWCLPRGSCWWYFAIFHAHYEMDLFHLQPDNVQTLQQKCLGVMLEKGIDRVSTWHETLPSRMSASQETSWTNSSKSPAHGSHLLGTEAASEVVSEVKREDEARWARAMVATRVGWLGHCWGIPNINNIDIL